jgi:hypothetical protein
MTALGPGCVETPENRSNADLGVKLENVSVNEINELANVQLPK